MEATMNTQIATVTVHTDYDQGIPPLHRVEKMPLQDARDALARRIRQMRTDGQFVTRIGPGHYEFETIMSDHGGPDWWGEHLIQTPDRKPTGKPTNWPHE
jgi:hypothetical protein